MNNIIKGIAVTILGGVGTLGLFAIITIPFVAAVTLPLAPLVFVAYVMNTCNCISLGGVAIALARTFDWHVYSDKDEVNEDCILLTSKKLCDLVHKYDSLSKE